LHHVLALIVPQALGKSWVYPLQSGIEFPGTPDKTSLPTERKNNQRVWMTQNI
jgi:hypothetical protein